MPTDLGALLLADARLPTGAHAQSAGLEPVVQAGVTVAEVPEYIEARLRTVALVEAAAAVLSWRTAARPGPGSGLREVQQALAARMPSAPTRTASERLGRGLARLAERLRPDHVAVLALGELEEPPLRPVALGVVAAAFGLDEPQVARASLYDDVQTVTAAALKLLPLDPIDATAWLLEAAPTMEEVVARACTVSDADALPALTAPLIEQYALDHDARTRRIFVA